MVEQSKAFVERGGRPARGGAGTRAPTSPSACPHAGGVVPSSVSGETRGFYEYYGKQRPLTVVTDLVDWPEEAATADTLELLPADRLRQYSSPEGLLADEADWGPRVEPVNTVPSMAEYRKLVERLYSLKMVRFLPVVEAVNGLFCVEKDGELLRLIVDCRPSNRKFRPPDKIELPGPDAFAQLQAEDSVYVSKYVRSAFYPGPGLAWCRARAGGCLCAGWTGSSGDFSLFGLRLGSALFGCGPDTSL